MPDKHVGERIRDLRRGRRLTLEQLAGTTGLTASFLSQMERNLTGVTLSSLVNIAKALEVPLRELVAQPAPAAPDTHQGAHQDYSVEPVSMHYERLSAAFPGSRLHAVKIRVPAGYASGLESHEGEELLYILAGRLECHVEHHAYHLGQGDSVHIDSHRPHRIANPGPAATDLLWTSTFQVFDDSDHPFPPP